MCCQIDLQDNFNIHNLFCKYTWMPKIRIHTKKNPSKITKKAKENFKTNINRGNLIKVTITYCLIILSCRLMHHEYQIDTKLGYNESRCAEILWDPTVPYDEICERASKRRAVEVV